MTQEKLDLLHNHLVMTVDFSKSQEQKKHNILQFAKIPRQYDGFDIRTFYTELQILTYITSWDERIYMKGPGKESRRSGAACFPYDLRPVLTGGRNMRKTQNDMTTDALFDIILTLAKRNPDTIYILITVLSHLCFLHREIKDTETVIEIVKSQCLQLSEKFEKDVRVSGISGLYHHNCKVEATYPYTWPIALLGFSREIWEILNEMFSLDGTPMEGYSFEALICYFDMLLQNEDSKMAYYQKNGLWENSLEKGDTQMGRENTVRSALRNIVLASGIMTGKYDEIDRMDKIYDKMNPVPLYTIQVLSKGLIQFDNHDIETDRARYQKTPVKKDFLPDGVNIIIKEESNAYPAIKSYIDSLRGQCTILAGSIINPNVKGELSQEAEIKRLLIRFDDNGLVLEDADLGECTITCLRQIIIGSKSAKWNSCSISPAWDKEWGWKQRV